MAIVRQALNEYATRGVFRSFSEAPERGGAIAFRFLWFRDLQFRIVYDPRRRTLTFPDLLPDVPARSELDCDLRTFVKQLTSKTLPPHRRLDSSRLDVTCLNRRGRITIVCTLNSRHVEYGVRRSINLVYEIFMDFLNDDRLTRYLVDHFNLDPEMA